jgi:hypothetical protein
VKSIGAHRGHATLNAPMETIPQNRSVSAVSSSKSSERSLTFRPKDKARKSSYRAQKPTGPGWDLPHGGRSPLWIKELLPKAP